MGSPVPSGRGLNPMSLRQNVGLDSQCLSYLIDAVHFAQPAADAIEEQKLALVQIWLYAPIDPFVPETVKTEYARIGPLDRRELHDRFVAVHVIEPAIQDSQAVTARTKALMARHSKEHDCRVLAEAEDLELDVLLTYDFDFRKRLGAASSKPAVLTPLEYWDQLAIPHGAIPRRTPHASNPLRDEAWWRW